MMCGIAAVDDDDVELVHELAAVASSAALRYFEAGVAHELKLDGSPVSDADLAVEKLLIDLLRHRRPRDGILSEEAGQVAGGRRRWLLDPIDGTTFFINGEDDWGTHVALEIDGRIRLAVITRPIAGRRWWAVADNGAYADTEDRPMARHQRLTVSRNDRIERAAVGVFAPPGSPVPFLLEQAGARVFEPGSLIPDLLDGRLDAVVAHNCGFAWDHAPAVLLVAEAGGRFIDPQGGQDHDRNGGLYTNGQLDLQLLRALGSAWPR
jgi:histidinol-phosphatase